MYIILDAKILIACFNKMSQILQNSYNRKGGGGFSKIGGKNGSVKGKVLIPKA